MERTGGRDGGRRDKSRKTLKRKKNHRQEGEIRDANPETQGRRGPQSRVPGRLAGIWGGHATPSCSPRCQKTIKYLHSLLLNPCLSLPSGLAPQLPRDLAYGTSGCALPQLNTSLAPRAAPPPTAGSCRAGSDPPISLAWLHLPHSSPNTYCVPLTILS